MWSPGEAERGRAENTLNPVQTSITEKSDWHAVQNDHFFFPPLWVLRGLEVI